MGLAGQRVWHLHAKGAAVVVAGGRMADAVAAEVQNEGGQAIAIPLDVTVPEQVRAAVDTTVEIFGRLDILFNNAGVLGRGKLFEVTAEEFDRVMAVNVKGCLLCTQAAAKVMRDQGDSWAHHQQLVNLCGRIP